MSLVIYNAAILSGRWSGVEWAVWQRAVELSNGKSPEEFIFLVAKGVTLPSPLSGGRIVYLPRYVATRLGRIFYELFRMPRLVRKLGVRGQGSGKLGVRGQGSGVRSQGIDKQSPISHLLSVIRYLLSVICDAGGSEEAGLASFFAPAYVAPPRLPCPFTLCLYDLHVYTHPQFCTRLNRLHYRWRMPSSIRRAKTIEVPSRHVLETLVARFPEVADKTIVRPLALRERFLRPVTDAEKAAVREKYALPARYILFVGTPTLRKNLPAALAAWRSVRVEDPDLGFVIAGNGKREKENRDFTQRRRESEDAESIKNKILATGKKILSKNLCGSASLAALRDKDNPTSDFQPSNHPTIQPSNHQGRRPEPPPAALGYVPDADMPALYACASVLLYPSFDEGYGLPIAEAQACGCPIVTSTPTAHEIAPDAILCGTDEASIVAALRHLWCMSPRNVVR